MEQRETERDSNLDKLFDMVRDLRIEFMSEVKTLSAALQTHMRNEEHAQVETMKAVRTLAEKVESLSGVVKAFPHVDDGTGEKYPDFHGHRADHEERMNAAKGWEKFRWSLVDKAGGVAVSAILILLVMGWNSYNTEQVRKALAAQQHDSQSKETTRQLIAEAVAQALKENRSGDRQ